MAGRFRSPKSKEEETSLVSEATPKATQYNPKWDRKVFEKWQQRRQIHVQCLKLLEWPI